MNSNNNYWDNKFWAYMHDPFDKCFDIKGHIERAKQISEVFGLIPPNNEFWNRADGIASGFERGQVPGYDPDEEKSGAIDFLVDPILTHPTGEKCHLKPLLQNIDHKKLFSELIEFLKKDIGMKAGEGGYSDKFKSDPQKFSIARFLYIHLVLRFRLANENIGGIGALWHRLPADTRFPDHSIWQHNALVSAIQSCFELTNENDLGMMVVSITPVQSFISSARKLRDFWTGSVFLSYLAFEGIKWVIENLGPDHILYPSLIDQFLVNEYLKKSWQLDEGVNFLNQESSIASFPNKFLFFVPFSKSEDFAKEIENSMKSAWENIYNKVYEFIVEKLDNCGNTKIDTKYIKELFQRQNDNFWDIKWASVKMLSNSNRENIEGLLSEKSYKSNFELYDIFTKMIENKQNYQKSGIGLFYSISHTLCQSVLAAEKSKKRVVRKPESGEKCHICGEFEVLYSERYQNDRSAKEYNDSIRKFWSQLKQSVDGNDGMDLKDNERLCSICATKRFAYRVLQKDKNHLLQKSFLDTKYFPSTTYIALNDYFRREEINNEDRKLDLSQRVHEDENSFKISNKDKYYAILLMDGDNMGKLINGETIAATWESVIHPKLLEKINKNNTKWDKKYLDGWRSILNNKLKRNITPAIHASISESLGDFALYGVSNIIKKYEGKLIYAGGDDVCAVLPIDYIIDAAKEISDYYKSSFKLISKNGKSLSIEDLNDEFELKEGKLSINLGKGKDISISAGVLICHHKASLKNMINEAHELLDRAKEKGGRNALAVSLKKRSGGDRYFITKWDSEKLESFKYLKENIGEEMSRSLAYKLAEYKDGIDAILKSKDPSDLLQKFVLSIISRSGKKSQNREILSKCIANIIVDNDGNFTNEPLIIAGFLHRDNKEE